MEARALCTNIVIVTAKFLYDHIFTQFGCPFTIVTNQGTHFINNAIRYLINHFFVKYTKSIIYYPQRNGQVESTNKVFETIFTKLMNDNQNEHMSTILFSYRIVSKVGTSYTPFQFTYGLHMLLLAKSLLPSNPG